MSSACKGTVACIQMTSGPEPLANLEQAEHLIRRAAGLGAKFVTTPETTNLIQPDRTLQAEALFAEADDPCLAGLRALAQELNLWILAGSLVLKGKQPGRRVNRGFLLDDQGRVRARYDKIHLFDVDLGGGEAYRESATYDGGSRAVTAESPFGRLGLTICYDLRFPALYRHLALDGAEVLTVPSAFTVPTGQAHWEILLRARAIETASFVLAPAQVGEHAGGRKTYGHSLIIDPWGRVLADGGERTAEVILAEIDLEAVREARRRLPVLQTAPDWR